MTKDQLINFLANQRYKKILAESEWTDLTTAFAGYDVDQKNDIAKQIATGTGQNVIDSLRAVMIKNAKELALTEATAALSDDALTLAELDSLLS